MEHQHPPMGGFHFADSNAPSLYSAEQTPQRRASFENPDSITPSLRDRHNASPNPFNATPLGTTAAATLYGNSSNASAVQLHHQNQRHRYFRSRRVKKGEVDQPWRTKKDPREKWVTIIPLIGLALGFALAGFLIYDGLRTITNHTYKLILDENWSSFDTNIWTKEVNVGGFGNGEFDETTASEENVFIKDGKLVIKPTLQDESLIVNNNNYTPAGCTGTQFQDCNAVTNTTNGTIVPPVKSGRINTQKGATLKYGRVEVTATLPEGDWLWPAIWLLPVNNTYGPWPASGEIDIMESRGNNYTYAQGGNNIMSSALHWGPVTTADAWWRTNDKRNALHTTFSKKAHTFGLEWSEKYLFTYIDTRLLQVLYSPFVVPMWTRGQFPLSTANGTTITNPWVNGGVNAPFDQEFYLILNVAVGGTNGWFEDGKSGKPWVDKAPTAKKDFWDAKNQWLPTWKENAQMEISSVKMWQQVGN